MSFCERARHVIAVTPTVATYVGAVWDYITEAHPQGRPYVIVFSRLALEAWIHVMRHRPLFERGADQKAGARFNSENP